MGSPAHARIGSPSAAGIWGKPGGCTAYPTMSERFEDLGDKSASEEGTIAHNYAEKAFREGGAPDCADPEMVEGIMLYLDHIRGLASYCDQSGVELRVDIPEVHEESFGTTDFWAYHVDSRTIYVRDFKYGLQSVDPFENLQMIMYGAGLLELFPDAHHVDLGIVQPRGFGSLETIRLAVYSVEEMAERWIPQLREAALESASVETAVARSGEHCKHCTARHDCPAALRAAGNLFEASSQALPLDLTPAAIGAHLETTRRAIKQLEAVSVSMQQQLEAVITGGANVPGWQMAKTQSNLKWDAELADVLELGDMMDVDLRKAVAPVTPTQAKELFRKKGIDSAVTMGYCSRISGLKLERVNFNKFKKVFSNVTTN